jgi:hypothetical protein
MASWVELFWGHVDWPPKNRAGGPGLTEIPQHFLTNKRRIVAAVKLD